MKFIIKILMLALLASPAYAANATPSYLCTHDDAIGFVLKEDKWTPGILNIKKNTLIIQKLDDSQWGMYIQGGGKSQSCSGNFDESGFFECHLSGLEFYFNLNSLRFQIYLRDGYVMGDDAFIKNNPALHPSLAIGTCTISTESD